MQGEIIWLQSGEIVTILAEELTMASHVRLQTHRPVGCVTADAAVMLLASCMDIKYMPAQVPQVPCCIAATQASKRSFTICLELHISSFYVLEQRSNAGFDIPGRWKVLGTVASWHRELADEFGVVGDVRVEADEVFTGLLAAGELLVAHIALIRFCLGVDTGTMAAHVVEVVGSVRALLTLMALLLGHLNTTANLTDCKLMNWISVASTVHESTAHSAQCLINITQDTTPIQSSSQHSSWVMLRGVWMHWE